MVEIDIAFEGSLRCRSAHGPSGVEVRTDAPTDNQGLGASFSPTDLVATGLGTCMLTILGIAAAARGIDVTGARGRVVKRMVADPNRRIGALDVHLEFPVEVSEQDRRALEAAAHSCPVKLSLAAEVEVTASFEWGVGAATS